MPITKFGPFPPSPNVGHIHFDTVTGGEFMYMGGGVPSDPLHWKLVGGNLSDQPDITGWGVRQIGARWYNTGLGNFFGWNGFTIVIIG